MISTHIKRCCTKNKVENALRWLKEQNLNFGLPCLSHFCSRIFGKAFKNAFKPEKDKNWKKHKHFRNFLTNANHEANFRELEPKCGQILNLKKLRTYKFFTILALYSLLDLFQFFYFHFCFVLLRFVFGLLVLPPLSGGN